jgi:hypothetical protein
MMDLDRDLLDDMGRDGTQLNDQSLKWLFELRITRDQLVAHNGPDRDLIEIVNGRYKPFPKGFPALIFNEWRCGRFVDRIAWTGKEMAMKTGHGFILGMDYLQDCYDWLAPIPVFKNPVEWLAADGDGIVIVDPNAAWRILLDFDHFLARDYEHSKQLLEILSPRKTKATIYFDERAAAA